MHILVYGAGVIGCELAHELIKAGNQVTLLARGAWKNILDQNGLVIRHVVQFNTTTDHLPIIDQLKPQDFYDLIFITMQFNQIQQVLPILAENVSPYLVFVGNNLDAEAALKALTNDPIDKEIAFGFQGSGGRRENGKVLSVHARSGMTVGALHGSLSSAFQNRLNEAFQGTKYRLKWEQDMDAWLKCHMAFILPIAYVCYATDCRLQLASRSQLNAVIDATIEAHQMLKKLGIPIRPDGEEEYFTEGRQKCSRFLWIMAKTPLGRLVASDHCRNAVSEMTALDQAFEELRQKADHPMPTWDLLRSHDQPRPVCQSKK